MRWRITIEAHPYSTGAGADTDQKAAGDRVNYFYVNAESIDEAMKMARCFAEGMKRSPAIWEAPVMGVHVYRDGATP